MSLDVLQDKLLAAARRNPPGDQVPYAFEKRIMACLRSAAPFDVWTLWGRALWRGALSSLAVMLLCSGWILWPAGKGSSNGDFSENFELAVFAMADQMEEVE